MGVSGFIVGRPPWMQTPPGCRPRPGCRLPLDADPPDANPPDATPPPNWMQTPPCGQTNTCEKHNLCELRLRTVMIIEDLANYSKEFSIIRRKAVTSKAPIAPNLNNHWQFKWVGTVS